MTLQKLLDEIKRLKRESVTLGETDCIPDLAEDKLRSIKKTVEAVNIHMEATFEGLDGYDSNTWQQIKEELK